MVKSAAALCTPPVSHRGPEFLELMHRTRASLTSLVNAPRVTLMIGSGTAAELLCRRIQQAEWVLLFDHCFHQATRS